MGNQSFLMELGKLALLAGLVYGVSRSLASGTGIREYGTAKRGFGESPKFVNFIREI